MRTLHSPEAPMLARLSEGDYVRLLIVTTQAPGILPSTVSNFSPVRGSWDPETDGASEGERLLQDQGERDSQAPGPQTPPGHPLCRRRFQSPNRPQRRAPHQGFLERLG